MTPTSARIDEDFTARFYRREPIVLELQLEDADGAAEDLANRRFFAALYQPSGEVFDRVEATIATGTNGRPYLSFAFHGDITDALYEQQLLRYALGEQLDSGQDVIVDGVLKILPAPTGTSTTTAAIVDGIATRFVRRLEIAGRSRIVVSERGPAGLSAAQIAVAANDIADPSPAAFMNHLRDTARAQAVIGVGDTLADFGEAVGQKFAEVDDVVGAAVGDAKAFVDGAQVQIDAKLRRDALPTTTFAALHLTVDRALEQWFGADRLNVMGLGVKGDGATLDTNAIRDAISRMRDTGIPLLFPSRPYAIAGDFLIAEDFDGFAAMFEGSGAAFIQKAFGAGLWNIRGNNAKLTGNFGAVYEGVRVPINGRYRGYTAFQRMCAVWVEGSGLQIDGTVAGNNMFNTVCHRGPVKRLDGSPVSDTDTAALLDGSLLALNNYIRRITCRGQDFALTGTQWDGFTVGSLYARTITAKQLIPPHAIYATPGGLVGAKAKNTTFGPMRCIDSPFGTAFKMRYFESGTIGPLSGDSTAGALSAAANSGVAYQLGDWTNLIGNIPPDTDPEDDAQVTRSTSAIDLQQCSDVTVTGGLLKLGANQSLNGTRIRMGCKAIVIQDTVYSDNQAADQTATPFRSEGAEVTFVNVSRQRLGVGDKEMFVATSGPNAIVSGSPSMASTVRTVMPRQRGSTRLAVTDTASTISGTFDSGLIEGYLPTTSMSGAGIQLTDTRRKDFTFVPTLLSQSGTQPPSYTVQGGRCIRTGNTVTYEIHLGGTTTGFTSTSVVEIGNLPYRGQTSGMPTRWIARVTTDGITVAAGSTIHAVMSSAGLPSARLQIFTDQARANLLASAVGSTWRIDFSLTIETDDPF